MPPARRENKLENKFDIAIIGSGPGGYVAALRAARLGKKVCVIERGLIGGTCLNRGCIPTKAYAASRDALHLAQRAGDFGIDTGAVSIDFSKVFNRKKRIVKDVRMSVVNLLKGNKIALKKGRGKIIDTNRIAVTAKDGTETELLADNIIIATGSKPLNIPALKIDHERILTSNDLLKLDELPKNIVIIGGGIIGCEFASIFSAFGVDITIVELLDNILPTVDRQISNIVKRSLKTQGVTIKTGVKVEAITVDDGGAKVALASGETISTEKVLVSIGRAPNTKGLELEELGVEMERGRITVDQNGQTSIKNIYAIGDVTLGPMLAHKASHDGINAVHSICGLEVHTVKEENIPSVVFTDPEVAYVGLSEADAKAKAIDHVCGRFSYSASSKAACMGETKGLIKIVAKKDTGVIIGASICGAHASDLIYGLGVAISRGLRASEVYETVFAHPTLCEGVKEALEEIDGLAIHKILKTRGN